MDGLRPFVALGSLLAALLLAGCTDDDGPRAPHFGSPEDMRITSSAFQHEGLIPSRFTCDGENISPPLRITGLPSGAAALALIMDDPDAPRATWVHWTFWNLPIGQIDLAAGRNVTSLGAVEGTTSFGDTGYGGPCPPSGTHRYFFKAYALDQRLDLPAGADIKELEQALDEHTMAWGQMMGRYARSA